MVSDVIEKYIFMRIHRNVKFVELFDIIIKKHDKLNESSELYHYYVGDEGMRGWGD